MHKDAVVQRANQSVVYVVDENSSAAIRIIQTRVASADRLEVISGLEVGDSVVIRGNERLKPGQALNVANP